MDSRFGRILDIRQGSRPERWISGNRIVGLELERTSSFYDQKSDREYRLTVNKPDVYTRRQTLRIGSKWEKYFGTRDTNVRCQIKSRAEVDTEAESYRTKICPSDDLNCAKNIFYNFFVPVELDVWTCTDDQQNQFLRVKNHFKLSTELQHKVKEIRYYDGVTILLNFLLQLEIVEVKFLDPTKKKVSLFDGRIIQSETEEKVQTLPPLAIRDINYVIGRNEILAAKLPKFGFLPIEFGERWTVAHNQDNPLQIYSCSSIVGNLPSGLKDASMLKITLLDRNKFKPGTDLPAVTGFSYSDAYIKQISSDFWECEEKDNGGSSTKLYRVVNRFKLEPNYPFTNIFHHDGVILTEDNGEKFLEETKYITWLDGTYHTIKFEGFTYYFGLKSNQYTPIKNQMEGDKFKDFEYRLDTDILNYAAFDKNGITFKVITHTDAEIGNKAEGRDVTCTKMTDRIWKPARRRSFRENPSDSHKHGTNIYIDYLAPERDTSLDIIKYVSSSEVDLSEYSIVAAQEKWDCKYDGEDNVLFYRIVNRYLTEELITRIYFSSEVEVYDHTFGGKKYLLIKHEKIIEPITNFPVKYIGKMKLLTEVIRGAENLLSFYNTYKMTSDMNSCSLEGVCYTMDVLRSLALLNYESKESNKAGNTLESPTKKPWQIKMTSDRGYRVLQVGRGWEEVFTAEKEMRCLLDEWNNKLKSTLKYIPPVFEFIDGNLYELDEEGFRQIFKIVSIQLFVCSNQNDEILRVRTVLQENEINSTFAIKHTDNVDLRTKLVGSSQVLEIEINEYMDMMTSKVLKYNGAPPRIIPSAMINAAGDSAQKNGKSTLGRKIGDQAKKCFNAVFGACGPGGAKEDKKDKKNGKK
ncbi:hypothetical protein LSTR_LSTR008481 [Laodelphax striatellus]|uniref:Uncharacterized protein n=1 Tax=Laodelphax striatellus TaxID=195883 RepID=A0A482X2P4_LAOST|nr:hypothetical protein LSTR_LSTR008481 [Laodelphax striatellus]